jgi:hypothetical protein
VLTTPIKGGPLVCQDANRLQCYQPSAGDQLVITALEQAPSGKSCLLVVTGSLDATNPYVNAAGGGGGSSALLINDRPIVMAKGGNASNNYLNNGMDGQSLQSAMQSPAVLQVADTISVFVGGDDGWQWLYWWWWRYRL